jgi:hypothetical protein
MLTYAALAQRLGSSSEGFGGPESLHPIMPILAPNLRMDVSRHKSVHTLRGYVRDADAFRDHAGAGLL